MNKYIEEYRNWAIKNNICIRCYKEKAWNGRQMCPECLYKAQECSEKTRSESSKEQRRKYIKRKRELCIAFGVCRECLKRKATVGLKCSECHIKEVKRNENRRTKVPRNMRIELKLCYFCGEPAIEGKKVCEKHYEVYSKNILKSKHDTSNHVWRKIQSSEIKYLKYKAGGYKHGKA